MTQWGADPRGDRWESGPADGAQRGWSQLREYGDTMPLPRVDGRYEPDDAHEGAGAGATPLDRLGWGDSGSVRGWPAGRRPSGGPAAAGVVLAAALAVAVFGAGGIAALVNSGGPDVIVEPGRSGLASPTRPTPTRSLGRPSTGPAPVPELAPGTAPGGPITPGTLAPVAPVLPPTTGSGAPSVPEEPSLPSNDRSRGDVDEGSPGGGGETDAAGRAVDDGDEAATTSAGPRSAASDGDGDGDGASAERPEPGGGQAHAEDIPPAPGQTRIIPIRPHPTQAPQLPPEATTPATGAPTVSRPTTTPPATTSTPQATTSPVATPSAPPDEGEQPEEPRAPRTVGPIVIPTESDGSLPGGPIVIPTGPDGALPTGAVTASPTPDAGDQDSTADSTATAAPATTTITREPALRRGDPASTGDGAPSSAPGGTAGGAASRPASPTTSGSLPPVAGRLSALLPPQPSGTAWDCRPLTTDVGTTPQQSDRFRCTRVADPPANGAAAVQPGPAARARRRGSSRSGMEVL